MPEKVRFLLTLSGVVAKLGRDFVGVALAKQSGVSSLSNKPPVPVVTGAGEACVCRLAANGEYNVSEEEPFLALDSSPPGDSDDALSLNRRRRAGLGDQMERKREADRVRCGLGAIGPGTTGDVNL